MVKLLPPFRRKLSSALSVLIFLLAFTFSARSQTAPGMSLSWDKQVGCQVYGVDGERKDLFLTDIEETECIRVCEGSYVTYTISNLPAGATTAWSATGGTASGMSSTSCTVSWGAAGAAALSFTITNGSSILTKTLCIEKVLVPEARFEIAPSGQSDPVYTCTSQNLNFINSSGTNNGTNLVSYYWDFGDGGSSTAFEPAHTFTDDGVYWVTLIVTNECNCSSTFKRQVIVKSKGFEISCPSVICEGQSQIYSLPFDGMAACQGNFDWSVAGGHILSQQGGNVEVLWDAVDAGGFGYVTFDPGHCNLECGEPTTIKIPVIQARGRIQGVASLCLGEQGRYKLPQWPTTEITWQIVGNVANNLGEIFQTDQRNEVIVVPHVPGQLTLRATYTNTLLHCGGEAELRIQVGKPLEIIGSPTLCQNTPATYTNADGAPANWILTSSAGAVLSTQNNSTSFSYPFNAPGNFVLTAEADGYCAGQQKTISVVGTPAAPAAVSGDLTVCPNSPYTYAVTAPDASSNYHWVVTNGTIIGADTGSQVNITFTGFPATVKVYRKTISPIECTSSPLVLTINPIPVNVALSSNFTAVCGNSLATYQALNPGTTSLYAGGDTYTWSFSNPSLGSVTSGQGTNSIDVTWNNVNVITTVNLILTVGKCNISPAPQFIKTVTLYPKTKIKVVASSNPVCAGGLYPVTFTVQSDNGIPLAPTDIVTWSLGFGEFTTPAGQFTYTTTLNNPSTVNIGQVMTAFIGNANNCGATNTASVTVTVLPNPPGIATLASSANAFCLASQINASIIVSSNTAGVTFVWMKNGTPIVPAQTGTSLNVTPAMGFGTYTFQVTNTNGCKTISNPVYISQICTTPGECTIAESVSNTSSLTACGQITFSGTHTGAAISETWQVLGPSPSDYSVSGGVLTGKPGNYKIVHKVLYNCQQGGTAYINAIKDVVIPYAPDFSYTVQCAGNNSFNVNFLDNSAFFANVSPQNVRFYYKLSGASSFTGPVAYNSSMSVFEMSGLPAGTYIFRQEVDGAYPSTAAYTCSKEYTVNLQGINPTLSIIVNQNQQINCYNTAVKFDLSPPPSPGTTVLWDFNDSGSQNTMVSTSRVFNTADHPYNVTCTVTNQYGCSRVLTASVYIPKKCFFGNVVATPANATVCQGQSVTLNYVPNSDNCAVANYVWMNGNVPVAGAPNSSQFSATSPGFYWVKVSNANGCDYNTPGQIKPLFNTLPTVKLLGETTYCQDDIIQLTVNTNASNIRWYVNGTLYSQFNNQTQALLNGLLNVGNNTVSVTVTSAAGCSNSAAQTINIQSGLQNIDFDVQVYCDPYRVEITALPTPYSGNITYNWSNGENTQTINVADGGAYAVTATLGGCSYTAQVDVPKNPEDYIWIFPSGCYTDCATDLNYLVGPTLPLNYWGWNVDGYTDSSGTFTAAPYTLVKDGLYTLTIDTGNCQIESAPLDYATDKCDKCDIDRVVVDKITKNDAPYCSYTYTLIVVSGSPYPYQISLSDDQNNVLILPSSFTLQPGFNYLTFTVIPQSPFSGGSTFWTLQGAYPVKEGYVECLTQFKVDVPDCGQIATKSGAGNGKEASELENAVADFMLYPNPAKELVTIRYNFSGSTATVEVYDISGRNISKNMLTSSNGEIKLDTSTYAAGMYMVVVRQNGVCVAQKKLVIE